MVFAEGLSYQLPLQSHKDAYIWDIGGQATISGKFNTMESIDIDPLGLHNNDVFGADDNFYDCDTHNSSKIRPPSMTWRVAKLEFCRSKYLVP